ncbi:centromere protein L [Sardina pilchardus]|uniref:centromere protein L n=1 Tax=Sardina pilchardus TaxID=27697 RepID=UPI002E11A4A6
MDRRSAVNTSVTHHTTHRRSKSYGRTFDATSRFCYTPGQLTITRIPTSREAAKAHKITEKVDPEQVALLVKKEWKLSHLTPLYQFRYTLLNVYAKHLSAFLVAEKQQGTAVEVGLETGFKVTFSTILGMAETKDDAETVFIQIHSKPVFASAGDTPRVVWSGWLTCINGDPEYLQSLPPEFVSLPLFCTSGSESLTFLVKLWFERTFDCSFGSLSLDPNDLHWLAALWTGCHSDNNIRSLKLAWTLPAQPPLDVSLALNGQDAWDLWEKVRPGDRADDSVSIEEVKCFITGIESHFFRHFKVHLSAGVLKRVSTALGSVHLDGKIKITCSDYMITVMTLLTECAILKMPTV